MACLGGKNLIVKHERERITGPILIFSSKEHMNNKFGKKVKIDFGFWFEYRCENLDASSERIRERTGCFWCETGEVEERTPEQLLGSRNRTVCLRLRGRWLQSMHSSMVRDFSKVIYLIIRWEDIKNGNLFGTLFWRLEHPRAWSPVVAGVLVLTCGVKWKREEGREKRRGRESSGEVCISKRGFTLNWSFLSKICSPDNHINTFTKAKLSWSNHLTTPSHWGFSFHWKNFVGHIQTIACSMEKVWNSCSEECKTGKSREKKDFLDS